MLSLQMKNSAACSSTALTLRLASFGMSGPAKRLWLLPTVRIVCAQSNNTLEAQKK
jgi:hypothetical protein